jgi:hypothetical protein
MKHPHIHTPQGGSPTQSKVTAGVGSKPCPLTHPWWIYRANQMKISNNHGTEIPTQIDSFPDEDPHRLGRLALEKPND